ncbi:BPIB3 protein, partial [Probosciger aterrimus]|nr:BPIB3 protein [Probosciger aterrimus]
PKMSLFWAVFLLCSLLTPSQGFRILPSVSQVDVDVLGKDGAVGGLLGGNGLLGGDGLLGGVLGQDGLLGGDGLLGEDGLLGGVLGQDVSPVPPRRLRILNNTLPRISLRALPGFGHQVDFNTQLLVDSSSTPGLPRCMQVEADVGALVQHKWAAPQSTQDCKTVDVNVTINLHHFISYFPVPSPKVPLLDQALKRLLGDVLREVGCNIVNTRLRVVSSLLGSRTPVLPLGALGDLPNFSIIGGDTLQLDLNLPAGDTEGAVGAPTTQGPPLTANLLLVTGRPPQLSLSQRALGVLLELAQEQGAFNRSITSSTVPNSISLSTSALLPLIPELAGVLPGSLPMELRVRVANEPVVAVRDGKATATLKASIYILSPALQSAQKLLFSLDADIVLSITPSVSDGKLQTSLALDSNHCSLLLILTCLFPLQVSLLAGWLKEVLTAAYLPAVNDALSVSVPLPKVPNISLRNTKVDITDVRI